MSISLSSWAVFTQLRVRLTTGDSLCGSLWVVTITFFELIKGIDDVLLQVCHNFIARLLHDDRRWPALCASLIVGGDEAEALNLALLSLVVYV